MMKRALLMTWIIGAFALLYGTTWATHRPTAALTLISQGPWLRD
jgi:hypothetical protein